LNYTNGVGTPQQGFDTTETAALTNTSGAGKTEKNSALLQGAANDETSSASAVDRASLSVNAVSMAQALSGSDVRADKIAELRPLIAAGTYNVSSSAVADKLFSALLQ
jgi:flagellar biosynthesis anti-sigma factor FlgM